MPRGARPTEVTSRGAGRGAAWLGLRTPEGRRIGGRSIRPRAGSAARVSRGPGGLRTGARPADRSAACWERGGPRGRGRVCRSDRVRPGWGQGRERGPSSQAGCARAAPARRLTGPLRVPALTRTTARPLPASGKVGGGWGGEMESGCGGAGTVAQGSGGLQGPGELYQIREKPSSLKVGCGKGLGVAG